MIIHRSTDLYLPEKRDCISSSRPFTNSDASFSAAPAPAPPAVVVMVAGASAAAAAGAAGAVAVPAFFFFCCCCCCCLVDIMAWLGFVAGLCLWHGVVERVSKPERRLVHAHHRLQRGGATFERGVLAPTTHAAQSLPAAPALLPDIDSPCCGRRCTCQGLFDTSRIYSLIFPKHTSSHRCVAQ